MNLPELGQYVGWFGGCVYLLTRAEGALKAWSNRRKLDRLIADGGPLPWEKHARSMKPPEPFRPHHVVAKCTGCGARVVASHFNGAHCEAPWPEDLRPEPLTLAPPVHGHRAAPPPLSRMRPPK
jgi:hypothetical protein